MASDSPDRPILFANSGVQVLSYPLPPGATYSPEQTGVGWIHARGVAPAKSSSPPPEFGYLQWQIFNRILYLAVDTTLAPDGAEVGYVAKAASLAGDRVVSVAGLLGADGKPLAKFPAIEFVVRSATAESGAPRDVHLIIDFGNSRTGALLLEFRGDARPEPLMTPLTLSDRRLLDAAERRNGLTQHEIAATGPDWWFSSRTQWCTTPYLPARSIPKTIYKETRTRTLLGGERVEQTAATVQEQPLTFDEISMARMGREAEDLAGYARSAGDVRSGVSSPKRYLWAKDASWLEGANWYMADPFGRYDRGESLTTLKGPLLRFISEEDDDDSPEPTHEEAPTRPRHAPRSLMTAALYELLCQAFATMNSLPYREVTGDSGRMRTLRTLVLTYPAGMVAAERAQFFKQAQKAATIFAQTVGRHQDSPPEVKLSIDEASAVHVTYLWSEARKLGRKPSFWFSVMGRPVAGPTPPGVTPAEEPSYVSPAESLSPADRVRRSMVRSTRGARPGAPAENTGVEVRIACIDVGGGTTDLMIAKYVCQAGVGGDAIRGEMLHRDGVSMAGDHLIKRLLECIIVPEFAAANGLEDDDVQTLFGPEVPANRPLRSERVFWVNRLLVPLAQAYLERAARGTDERISHTDPAVVAPEVVQSLQDAVNSLWGAGTYNVKQDLRLEHDEEEFENIVHEVFGDLMFDFCESIVEHQVDVVLLAGQLTKLPYMQRLVERCLPLSPSRIIPMYGRYAGGWYPYQSSDNFNPGVIIDAKSTVVVGAALEFASRHGMASQFAFRMSDASARKSYYWGVMTESRIDDQRLLFTADADDARGQRQTLHLTDQSLVIGRKRRAREDAQATPIYMLRVLRGARLGEIAVRAVFERRLNVEGEEELNLVEATGVVDGEAAVLGHNVICEWRTLADERYYLDTGSLDKIELARR